MSKFIPIEDLIFYEEEEELKKKKMLRELGLSIPTYDPLIIYLNKNAYWKKHYQLCSVIYCMEDIKIDKNYLQRGNIEINDRLEKISRIYSKVKYVSLEINYYKK